MIRPHLLHDAVFRSPPTIPSSHMTTHQLKPQEQQPGSTFDLIWQICLSPDRDHHQPAAGVRTEGRHAYYYRAHFFHPICQLFL